MTGTLLTRNEAELLTTGPEIFSALEQDMLNAQRRADIQVFSWSHDSTGKRLHDVLLQVHDAVRFSANIRLDKYGTLLVGAKGPVFRALTRTFFGVDSVLQWHRYKHLNTRMIFQLLNDATSIHTFSPQAQQDIEQFFHHQFSLGKLFEMNPVVNSLDGLPRVRLQVRDGGIMQADHGKNMVFDNVLYTGGVNLGDDYSGGYEPGIGWVNRPHWRDMMVRLEGPAVEIARNGMFLNEEGLMPRTKKKDEGSLIRFLRNVPGVMSQEENVSSWAREKQVSYTFFELLREAQDSIVLDHCYIMDDSVVNLLQGKADEGVPVTVLVSDPENFVIARGSRRFLQKLQRGGNVRVVSVSGTSHAKCLQVDGKYSLLGSLNATKESLNYQGESALLVVGESPLQQQVSDQLERLQA